MTSPVPGRSSLITSAPMSDRIADAKGAAAASSNATTRTPAKAGAGSGRIGGHLGGGEQVEIGRMGALPDHDRAAVLDDHLPVLVVPPRAHLHDPLLRPRAGFPRLEHLALRVQG